MTISGRQLCAAQNTRSCAPPGRSRPPWPACISVTCASSRRCAVLEDLRGLGLLVVDGYADLDPAGRPGLGAHAHAESGIQVIGVAKSRFRTATHAVPVVRGSTARPLFATAAGMPSPDAADLVRRMAGRYRPPDALRRADTLARTGPPAAAVTDRQPR
jgi:deoxyinosine 3'endonuclease (endonuclease V)